MNHKCPKCQIPRHFLQDPAFVTHPTLIGNALRCPFLRHFLFSSVKKPAFPYPKAYLDSPLP